MSQQFPTDATFEVRAVQVLGPPPTSDVYVDLAPGVTALYGLNGAGKSRLLDAVATLLSARPHGDGYVVCRSPVRTIGPDPSSPFLRVLSDVAAEVGVWREGEEVDLSELFAAQFRVEGEVTSEERGLADLLVRQGHWLLKPVGDNAMYYATPGFTIDELDPDLDRSVERTIKRWERERPNGDEPSDGAGVAWDELLADLPAALAFGPLASAIANRSIVEVDREVALLRRCAQQPYPVFDFDGRWGPLLFVPVTLAEVVTNRDLTHERLDDLTMDLIQGRLRELAEDPSADAVTLGDGSRRLRIEASPESTSPGRLVLRHISNELTRAASAILGSALPGRLSLQCRVLPAEEWFDGPPVRWRAIDETGASLPVGDLSDAQVRWSCLAVALALRGSRREADLEDLRRRIAGDLQQWRDEQLAEARDRFEDDLMDLELEVEAIKRQIEERDARVAADAEEESTAPDTGADGRTWAYADIEPDFEEMYEGNDDVLWDDADLEFELEDREAELSNLRAMGPDSLAARGARTDEEEALRAHLSHHPPAPLMVFIDEPEAGLHRAAERFVVQLLVRLSEEQDAIVFVATHSPEFLRDRSVRKTVVERRGPSRSTSLDLRPPVVRRTAAQLGLRPHDLLHLQRVILLVEGHHDELVLTELVGDQLSDLGVLVLPLHGGRLMPTAADSPIIAEFTDQPVVAMVDNVDQHAFTQLLAAARIATPGDASDFERRTGAVLEGLSARQEVVFMSRLLRKAFDLGRLDRFHPYGLSRRDVLEYLPVEHFVPEGGSWDALHERFDQQSKLRPFKHWAEVKCKASFDDTTIKGACRSLDAVDEDLSQLLLFLADVGSGSD